MHVGHTGSSFAAVLDVSQSARLHVHALPFTGMCDGSDLCDAFDIYMISMNVSGACLLLPQHRSRKWKKMKQA